MDATKKSISMFVPAFPFDDYTKTLGMKGGGFVKFCQEGRRIIIEKAEGK